MNKQSVGYTSLSSASRRCFLKGAIGVGAVLGGLRNSELGGKAQASQNIVRFDHVAVPMRHTDEMLSFYRGLGFHVNESPRI